MIRHLPLRRGAAQFQVFVNTYRYASSRCDRGTRTRVGRYRYNLELLGREGIRPIINRYVPIEVANREPVESVSCCEVAQCYGGAVTASVI